MTRKDFHEKAEMVKLIRTYKHIGLKDAIKVYNDMTAEELQQFLERIAENTYDYRGL